jgi:Zn-dependent protease with chaperone function
MFTFVNVTNALLQSFWQFAVLLLIFQLANLCINNKKTTYIVAVVLQFIGFIWFITTILTPHPSNLVHQFLLNSQINENFIAPIITIAYSAIVCFFVIRLMYNYVSLGKLNEFYAIIKPYLYNKKIVIKISQTVNSPFTYGFFKPVIVLPFSLCNNLTTKEMELVLLHEVAHILREDYVVNLVLKITDAFLFFNPFSKLLLKTIEQEREYCCDDWVLQKMPENIAYAQTLFAVAKQQQTLKNTYLVQAFAQPQYLLQRIKRITASGYSKNTFSIKQSLWFCAILLASLIITNIEFKSTSNKQIVQQNIKNNAVAKVQKAASLPLTATSNTKKNIATKKAAVLITKNKVNQKQQATTYTALDKKRLKEGFQFLSELAKENVLVKEIIETNPSIKAVEVSNAKPTEASRFFYIPKTKTSNGKIITITVIEKDNNDKKVVIDIEEIATYNKS